MSITKPTASELKEWDKVLQQEHLGMDRGHNSTRLIYGHDYNRTNDGTSLAAAGVWIRKRRKEHNAKEARQCCACGEEFYGRASAKCCPRPLPCRRQLEERLRQQRFQRLLRDLERGI